MNTVINSFSKNESEIHEFQQKRPKFIYAQCNTEESYERMPFYTTIMATLGFYFLIIIGLVNHLIFTPKVATEKNRDGYPPLYNKFESIFLRYVFRRVKDCFNRVVCGLPGGLIEIRDRVTHDNNWSFEVLDTTSKFLNLGSYNYLGFAQNTGLCFDDTVRAIKRYGWTIGSSRQELGTNPLHLELEKLTAEFLGVDDAIVFGMGFATNALNLPAIITPQCLVLSDEYNHASVILGIRLSGAISMVYKHNDVENLEELIRKNIVTGHPKTKKPWEKIFIITEGIFSMEGSIVKLPEIIAIKKKYKVYLYVDEAHSIGALGPNGGGVLDYYKCCPKDVDILMGTYTKSFGSAGGYIAGNKDLIDYLRKNSHASCYAMSMSPPVAQIIISSMSVIMGRRQCDEGQRRINHLASNVQYFRKKLKAMGCIVYGNDDSPVVPMLVYMISKVGATIREFNKYNIATVGVGFPATPLLQSRIRFCMSAALTKEQLDEVLEVTEKVVDKIGLRYSRKPRPTTHILYDDGI
ncbi:serine palmitoyltransferase 2 [Adelges cooleyi]|uniref:serine palmitoyltransferase 2 n=1 Tax=Adelges cooleyi TaxID=133065 RepID=UPI0021802585|nr:serine palmitoyltransferase 2 [Adelges cooleyi]XP_050424405.1 serine palmitoyltransferase 2 [Adelges cooleyi]XP_050424406.1 serine palmitoyltransferase 2 [Adelges cooleyi]XP_050424407.1 serine palmitoyltransferase 2 [Adelges cooleyi]XP_050424408.1 serine palmitoyltransferase 2 [Adelges cooleyi]XP_050424409.1 serine palmitoyltransferase 2 [Adelges cooleyi]XP_050424410.1 serine palmitoyltransferase 2 [Adelges cooleyi]